MVKQVVKYYIKEFGLRFEPEWWESRISDIEHYANCNPENETPKGCMAPDKLPFNAAHFMKYHFNKRVFFAKVLEQIEKKYYDHPKLMEHIRNSFENHLNGKKRTAWS